MHGTRRAHECIETCTAGNVYGHRDGDQGPHWRRRWLELGRKLVSVFGPAFCEIGIMKEAAFARPLSICGC